jgi:protein-S-isoprenylcysteine O-methyltransferase Ste14
MTDESTFRVLFTVMFAAFVLMWGWNFLSAGISGNSFYTPTEGPLVAVPLRLLLAASLVSIIVYIVNPRRMSWASLDLPSWIRWLGCPVGLAALLFFYWVLKSLGQNFSTSLTIKQEQTLITHGPYRRIRHPMYTVLIVLWFAYFLLSANWFIGMTGILAFMWTMIVRTPKEERMMIDRFGEEYIAYMKRTGRYLPRQHWR